MTIEITPVEAPKEENKDNKDLCDETLIVQGDIIIISRIYPKSITAYHRKNLIKIKGTSPDDEIKYYIIKLIFNNGFEEDISILFNNDADFTKNLTMVLNWYGNVEKINLN